ncbi:MAG: DeoR family transcriptional regulator [Treponema sp.]|jgi:DeoR/GlpR family transcriptional regulator of sugar metabolism|nr:DeoR family transcriptional regulator [Treponema sp.]
MTNRHTKILEILSKYQRIEVSILAEMLEVSQVTVRKDLEDRELIRREHGFACIDTGDGIGKRTARHYKVKHLIAQKAAETIEDGETVMIESGSRTRQFALFTFYWFVGNINSDALCTCRMKLIPS